MKRTRSLALRLSVIAALLLPQAYASAQSTVGTQLTFQPHCMSGNTSCPRFSVLDAQTLVTGRFSKDGILDIDVVLSSDHPASIASFRSWVQYDAKALELRNVQLLESVTSPMPGEQGESQSQGVIKLGGGVSNLTKTDTPVARLTFRVIGATTSLQFYGYKPDGSGQTSVMGTNGSSLLSGQPSALSVSVNTGYSSSAPATTNSSSLAPTSINQPQPSTSTFPLLQVQNVRVTTSDTSVLIGWDALPSSELVGYNVYYSTISGRYIQRRTIGSDTHSLVIRNLESGMQEFLAVRGFNSAGQETAFSQEVAVVVGRPETSTAPLSGDSTLRTTGKNPVKTRGGSTVTGQTGVSDIVLWLCLTSGAIGTLMAWRRQVHFSPASR